VELPRSQEMAKDGEPGRNQQDDEKLQPQGMVKGADNEGVIRGQSGAHARHRKSILPYVFSLAQSSSSLPFSPTGSSS
jgi:hypothetical protein